MDAWTRWAQRGSFVIYLPLRPFVVSCDPLCQRKHTLQPNYPTFVPQAGPIARLKLVERVKRD